MTTRALQALGMAAALALFTQAVLAQGAPIPPPRNQAKQNAERAKSAVEGGLVDGVTALPGQIVIGAGMLQQATGGSGAYQLLRQGDTIGTNFGHVVDGAKLLDSYNRGGQQAVFDSGTQMLLDKGGQAGAEKLLVKSLVRRAVVSGVGGALASGGASIAFEGGVILGGVARESWSINGKLLGDHVDDFYFGIAPDSLKEWVSGTKQVDWDSTQFQQQAAADAARRRRQATFQRVQDELAQQRAQQQQAAAAAGPAQNFSAPEPTRPDSTQAWLDALKQAQTAQNQALRSTPAPVARKPGCQLDPRTGCHPGHDEKSHPGGCKVC